MVPASFPAMPRQVVRWDIYGWADRPIGPQAGLLSGQRREDLLIIARSPAGYLKLVYMGCLVTADTPNGLICIGQQLGALNSRARLATLGSKGISGPITPGVMARRELP